jgi:hypothetical protein
MMKQVWGAGKLGDDFFGGKLAKVVMVGPVPTIY